MTHLVARLPLVAQHDADSQIVVIVQLMAVQSRYAVPLVEELFQVEIVTHVNAK